MIPLHFSAAHLEQVGVVGPSKNYILYFFFCKFLYPLIFPVSLSIYFTCINILVQTYRNIFKTNRHTIKKHIYLVVHITRQILNIRRIRTTLSENWDRPVILLKSGLHCLTKYALSDN